MKSIQKASKKHIILAAFVLVATLSLLSLLFLLNDNQKKTTEKTDSAAITEINSFANRIVTTKTYSTLPTAEKQEFLKSEAVKLGLDSRTQATPNTLVVACTDLQNRKLLETANYISRKENIEPYKTSLIQSMKDIRIKCYAKYDEDGKQSEDEMPKIMHH